MSACHTGSAALGLPQHTALCSAERCMRPTLRLTQHAELHRPAGSVDQHTSPLGIWAHPDVKGISHRGCLTTSVQCQCDPRWKGLI